MNKDEVLKKHEDLKEYHFHNVDRELIFEAMEEYSQSQIRFHSVEFAKYLESLSPVRKISVHPTPRNLSVDEIFDKYKKL